jgi:hypothetical protein
MGSRPTKASVGSSRQPWPTRNGVRRTKARRIEVRNWPSRTKAFVSTWATLPLGVGRMLIGRQRLPEARSVGLRVCGIVLRRPKRREVPAEVQFEVAPKTVTDITELGAARLRTGPRQGWEEHVVARLKLDSCRHPEQCQIENPLACRACVRKAKGSDRALHQNYRDRPSNGQDRNGQSHLQHQTLYLPAQDRRRMTDLC